MPDDTIVAISTPLGDGGIGIVRLSGEEAIPIADRLFDGQPKTRDFPSQTIHYGRIIDPSSGEMIDEVLLTFMRAPKSYTREDVVEINCHGGILPLRKILELTLREGARLAEPGEFTKRAYLNGRIDLAQAEAVIDIVRARSEASLKVAAHQLKGGLSKKISSLRQALIETIAHIEASIDFEDDHIEETANKDLLGEIKRVGVEIQRLLETARQGSILREGIKTVILGKPNVGKSSLLNALLGRERAIVTHLPGTTRDTIEETIDLDGISLKTVDTAGVRDTKRVLEREGVKRTLASLEVADLVLLVLDASKPITREDLNLIDMVKEGEKETIILLNKKDLVSRIEREEITRRLPNKRPIAISALKGEGIGEIGKEIKKRFFDGKLPSGESLLITHQRHKLALEETSTNLERAILAIESGLSAEFIALDLREAIDSLGEILGERVDEEILDKIFSQFCIGK